MNIYRYSPIKSETELLACVTYLHQTCHQLCRQSIGEYLPVAGNLGIFCHYDEEYEFLLSLRKQLAHENVNYNEKYFKLKQPITVAATDDIPVAVYDYLYIRRPDPYRSQVGDIDFVMEAEAHAVFKSNLSGDEFRNGARLFSRPEDNMIELFDPNLDVLSYVVVGTMRDLVETKIGTI